MTQEQKQRIDQVFDQWQRGVCPGGQVLIRLKGETVYSQCFGYADLERGVKVTPETIFHVASVSKQITTMCVLLLWERGLVDIDADIRTYIPDLVAFSEPVTVRDMMNNVSGIRDQWELQRYSGVRMPTDLIRQSDLLYTCAKQRSLNFEPRTKYLYSNTNFTYLAEIVSRIAKKRFAEFARENIFAPLGMDKTFVRERHNDLVLNRALSYVSGQDTFRWEPLNFSNWGATSLQTCADDFIKWLSALKKPTICKQETLDEMEKVPKLKGDAETEYACGLMVKDVGGHRVVGHGGADAGYRSGAYRFTDDDLDIVVFSNTENIYIEAACFKAARITLGMPMDESIGSEHYSDDQEHIAFGGYHVTEMGVTLRIEGDEEKAVLTMMNMRHELKREGGNLYRTKGTACAVYFKESGAVLKLEGYPCHPLDRILDDEVGARFKGLCGRYYSDEIETFMEITQEDGSYYLMQKRLGKGKIRLLQSGNLICPDASGIKFAPVRDEKGNVTAISLSGGRVYNLQLQKI